MPPVGAVPVDERAPLTQELGGHKRRACTRSRKFYIEPMNRSSSSAIRSLAGVPMPPIAHARFAIGDVVRHRMLDFRGVVFDIDPVFANTEEWYESIPAAARPAKDQPFYHLLAENADSTYVAYVSQQNLLLDESEEPVDHPAIDGLFLGYADGRYRLRSEHRH